MKELEAHSDGHPLPLTLATLAQLSNTPGSSQSASHNAEATDKAEPEPQEMQAPDDGDASNRGGHSDARVTDSGVPGMEGGSCAEHMEMEPGSGALHVKQLSTQTAGASEERMSSAEDRSVQSDSTDDTAKVQYSSPQDPMETDQPVHKHDLKTSTSTEKAPGASLTPASDAEVSECAESKDNMEVGGDGSSKDDNSETQDSLKRTQKSSVPMQLDKGLKTSDDPSE